MDIKTPQLDKTLLAECSINKFGRNPHTLAGYKSVYTGWFELGNRYGWNKKYLMEFQESERRLRKFLNTGVKE